MFYYLKMELINPKKNLKNIQATVESRNKSAFVVVLTQGHQSMCVSQKPERNQIVLLTRKIHKERKRKERKKERNLLPHIGTPQKKNPGYGWVKNQICSPDSLTPQT